jgi:hypothetical protein
LVGNIGGVTITNQDEPILSGTAEPQAAVSLSFRRLSGGDPVSLGETIADSTGHWSLIVGPIGGAPFLLYGVATPVTGPPTPITLLNSGQPIFVQLQPMRVTGVSVGPHANSVTLKVASTDPNSPDPVGLLRASSYAFISAKGRRFIPTSVRIARVRAAHPTAPRAVTLTLPRGALSGGGSANLVIDFNGVAGNNQDQVQIPVHLGTTR